MAFSISSFLSKADLSDVARRAVQIILIAVGFGLSFTPDPNAKVLYALAASVCITLAYILHDHKSLRLSHLGTPARVILWVMAVMTIWFWVRAFTSDVPAYSLVFVGIYSLVSIVTFLVVTSGYRRPPQWLVGLCGAIVLGIAGYGIYQTVTGAIIQNSRIRWPLEDPNQLAMILNAAVIACIAIAQMPKWKWVGYGAGAVFLIADVLTGSRGGLIALFVGLSVFMVPVVANGFKLRVHVAAVATVFVVLVFVIGGMLAHKPGGPVTTVSAMSKLVENPGDASESRFHIWASTIDLIKERPVDGFGTGVFPLVFPKVIGPHHLTSAYAAHNDFLQIWLETGVVGAGLYLMLGVMILIAFVQGVRIYRKKPDPDRALQMITCMGVILAIGVHAQIEFMISVLPVHIMLGLAIGFFITALPERAFDKNARSLSYRTMQVADVIVILMMGVYFSQSYAEVCSRRADAAARAQNFSVLSHNIGQVQYYSFNLSAYPYSQMGNYYLSMLAAGAAPPEVTFDTVQHMIDAALQRNPYLSSMYHLQGKLDQFRGLSPEDAWKKGLAVEPRNANIRLDLIRFYERLGKSASARELVDQARQWPQGLKGNVTELQRVMEKYGK